MRRGRNLKRKCTDGQKQILIRKLSELTRQKVTQLLNENHFTEKWFTDDEKIINEEFCWFIDQKKLFYNL
jgi:hypothetical protein